MVVRFAWFGLRGPLDQGRWCEGCSKQIWDLSTGGTLNQGLPHNIYLYLNMYFFFTYLYIFLFMRDSCRLQFGHNPEGI